MRVHRLAATAAVGGLALLWAADAHACHFNRKEDGNGRTIACFTTIHAGIGTAVFAPVDIYYAANDSWLPPKWAWTQLTLGGVTTFGGAATALGMAIDDSPNRGADIGWSVGLMALGSFYATHSILSLSNYEARPVEPQDDPANPLRITGFAIVPTDGGAIATLSF